VSPLLIKAGIVGSFVLKMVVDRMKEERMGREVEKWKDLCEKSLDLNERLVIRLMICEVRALR